MRTKQILLQMEGVNITVMIDPSASFWLLGQLAHMLFFNETPAANLKRKT